ncbi:MAG: hypothetical protein ACRCZE_00470 [Candidatus Altimarinota bacterium]
MIIAVIQQKINYLGENIEKVVIVGVFLADWENFHRYLSDFVRQSAGKIYFWICLK